MPRLPVPWLLVLVTLVALPTVVTASPGARSKVVQTLISAAQKEFDAANFERAGQLFLEIWRQDKTLPPALYNAARAHQLAGKPDKAEELYREYLGLPAIEASARTKVEEQLAELRLRRSELHAEDAMRAEKAGNYALAVQLWGDAIQIQPKPAWLLRRARAAHLAGQAEAAVQGYDRYLELAPKDAAERADAQRWLTELRPAAVPAKPVVVPPAEPPVNPTVPAPVNPTVAVPVTTAQAAPVAVAPRQAAPAVVVAGAEPVASSGVAWALTAGGATIGLAGVGLYLATLGDQVDYDASLQAKAGGKFSGTNFEDAQATADRINGRVHLAWAMGGVGAVATGVGVWMLLKTPKTVAVLPTPGGAVVAWRW